VSLIPSFVDFPPQLESELEAKHQVFFCGGTVEFIPLHRMA
jgi:hypothetical protein